MTCAQPTDVVKVRFQASIHLGSSGSDRKYSGTMDAYRTIAREEGVRGLWKGRSGLWAQAALGRAFPPLRLGQGPQQGGAPSMACSSDSERTSQPKILRWPATAPQTQFILPALCHVQAAVRETSEFKTPSHTQGVRTAEEISQDAATPRAGCGRGCPRGGAPEAGSAEKVTPRLGLED